jgi:hypothetical protein
MEYTHYHPETRTLLEVGNCENCGNRVQEPNAVKLFPCAESIAWLNGANLMVLGSLPPETFHDDELGHAACYGCK